MSYTKRLLCLANSWREGGRCIAGKISEGERTGEWIRPVRAAGTEAIVAPHLNYEDGAPVRILDIFDVHLIQPAPAGHQVENHVIEKSSLWRRVRQTTFEECRQFLDSQDRPLWPDAESTFHGINDKVPEATVAQTTDSLRLIQPASATFRVASETQYEGPPQTAVRATFDLAGSRYRLKITDPEASHKFESLGQGEHTVHAPLLCISLSGIFNGFSYRLVAGVILTEPTSVDNIE